MNLIIISQKVLKNSVIFDYNLYLLKYHLFKYCHNETKMIKEVTIQNVKYNYDFLSHQEFYCLKN